MRMINKRLKGGTAQGEQKTTALDSDEAPSDGPSLIPFNTPSQQILVPTRSHSCLAFYSSLLETIEFSE
jgi:hypothetical protein